MIRSGSIRWAAAVLAATCWTMNALADEKPAAGTQYYVAPGGDRASIPFGRGAIALRPETQAALAAAFAYIRHAALARQIVRTQGLYRLLAAYGREHRAHVARTGQLSFNDIAQLLAPASGPMSCWPCRRR